MAKNKFSLKGLLHGLHHSALGRIAIGLTLGLVILVVKVKFEHTEPYSRFRLWMYGVIQGTMGPSEAPSVQLVGISGIPRVEGSAVAPGGPAVSRSYLYARLAEIVAGKPRAVGVDVDFSPDEGGNPITLDDADFFRAVRELSEKSGVPIFLGVHRHAADVPSQWLGRQEFRSIAAGLGVGNDEFQAEAGELASHVPSVLRMLSWTKTDATAEPLRSLAFALAERDLHQATTPPDWLKWAVEVQSEFSPEPPLDTKGFLVSYRMLDALARSAMPIGQVEPARLRDKYVILGDIRVLPAKPDPSSRKDLFLVPGRADWYSGAILHGCAVDTLVNSPLRQWTHIGRIAVDLALALFGILIIEVGRAMFRNRGALIEWTVTLVLAALVVVVALPFAGRIRLMWDDAVIVALCLCLHTYIDVRLSKNLGHDQTHAPKSEET